MAYASKYYDPVKAHEYYDKHKKLKGSSSRTSTAGLSDEAKMIAKQVKESIMEEKKHLTDSLKQIMKDKIDSIRQRMKGLSSEEKESLKQEILALKEEFKGKKEKINEIYNEKYAQELDNLKADSSMLKPKKGKKSSKKKSKK